MARFRYDVNTQTKLLDIHKQFQGGLKTVDTDDSLKTLFLRQAENLELSEFGFLEKRYGQIVDKELLSSGLTASSNLQGYFEYVRDDTTIDKILIIDGKLFLSVNGASFTQITNIKAESGKRYPDATVFADLGMDIDDDFYTITDALPTTFIHPTTATLPTPDIGGGDLGNTAWVLADNTQYVVNLSNVWEEVGTVSFDMDLLKVHDDTNNHKYYYKKDTTYYEYEQVSGQSYYQLSSVSISLPIADADFQTTRPIEATRLDDTLYIFTGTYPIIYRGDGNFYLLDIYIPQFKEVVEFSHNYLENNHENAYGYDGGLSAGTSSAVLTGDLITHKAHDYYPDLPYNIGPFPGFNFQISYNYRSNSYLGQGDFDKFLDTDSGHASEHDAETVLSKEGPGASTGHIPTSGQVFVELFPVVYTRPAGGGESEWIELDKEFYNPEVRSNADASSLFNVGEFYEGSVVYQKDYSLSANRVAITQNTPLTVAISRLPLGEIDLRIEFVYVESGYTDFVTIDGTGYYYRFQQERTVVYQDDYINLNVTEEKVTDYNDYPLYNNYPDIWSANRVIPHYGKLLVYGSLKAPQNIYASHPKYKNYFAGFFSQEFTTEERDPIVKVAPFQNILVVMSEDYIWGLKGIDVLPESTNAYRQFTISPLYGTIAPDSVRPVRNYLMFLSKEGIMQLTSLYAVDEQYNVKPADENIRNIVPRVEDNKYDPKKAVAIQFEDQYWIHFPDKEEKNQNNMVLRYYADTRAWMKDVYFKKQSDDDIRFKGLHKWVRRTGKGLAYISLPYYDGNDYRIDEILLDYNIPSELGYPIQAIMETANLEQGYPFHPKQYKEAKLEFALQNEYNASVQPLFPLEDFPEDNLKSDFDVVEYFRIRRGHKYRFDFGKQITGTFTVTIGSSTYSVTENIPTADGQTSHYYEFEVDSPGFVETTADVVINVGDSNILDTDALVFSDITYDNVINFYVWVISDDNTLNLDNLESYSASLATQTENLGTRDGTWMFGDTDFGNRIAAIQTIRLSGKGKNVKLYLEEMSKSKWTLESIAFMYKLKRARGNR